MRNYMLTRFKEMKQDAKERGIKVSPGQLCVLVLADVVEDQGIAINRELNEIDKSLVSIIRSL